MVSEEPTDIGEDMIVNEGQKDGYDLVLRIPELTDIAKQREEPNIFKFILPVSVPLLFIIIIGDKFLTLAAFFTIGALILIGMSKSWSANSRTQKALNGLQTEVASLLTSECKVVPQDEIRLASGQTDFTVIQPDGAEMFWDLTPLDDEGRIGLSSRFAPA